MNSEDRQLDLWGADDGAGAAPGARMEPAPREAKEFAVAEERSWGGRRVPVFRDELWTARQRAGHSLHEISYRACYKPQLPAFFLRRYGWAGCTVYDPFMGRGTTLIEAQLQGCRAVGNDVNPLSRVLAGPRLAPPGIEAVGTRLDQAGGRKAEPEPGEWAEGLRVFFAEATLRELYGWREYFRERREAGTFDAVDGWIEMVACNRLTGHSAGFFSVYTLPPNQATSVTAQRKINAKRGQAPEYRDTRKLILRKSRQLLQDPLPEGYARGDALLLERSAEDTPEIPGESVDLAITSPPFLDVVDYAQDNWLRMWFCDRKPDAGHFWKLRSLEDWGRRMTAVLRELRRVLRPGGRVAFEVGEVRKGSLDLENTVAAAGIEAGLEPEAIWIHDQAFTKTAHCWGVENNAKGTNSNRIVVLRKAGER